jgi:SAM-dependent methyltransferase
MLLPEGNPYESSSADEYFHAHDPGEKAAAGAAIAEKAQALLGRTGRLLELGCGRGDLLRGAKGRGWQVRGVEMTPGFAREAGADVDIELASVERARSLDERYDVVVLAAILEHLYDPADCLRRVRDALAEGGLVFIDVPNECSLFTRAGNAYMRLRGRRWAVNLSPTFPPFHVVGFCPRSLRRLLQRARLEVVEMVTPRWQNELPRGRGGWAGLESAGVGAALTLGAALGMGSGLLCWARKPAA